MYYSESIAIESFIDFCDDYQIANESFSLQNAIDRIVETFTKIVEFFRRLLLQFQSKIRGNKYIRIPKIYHSKIQNLARKINNFWQGRAENLSDENMLRIKDAWHDIKIIIKVEREQLNKEYEDHSAVPAKEIYENLINDSKLITESLNEAKQARQKMRSLKDENEKDKYKELIKRLNNQVELARILYDMNKYYLSFSFIGEDGVDMNTPKSEQVVTKEERDANK